MAKELTELEQVLVDTIQSAGNLTGDVVNGVKTVGTKAIDFASEQIPDVIHQLLLWKFTISLIWFSTGVISLILLGIGLKKYWDTDIDIEIKAISTVFFGGLIGFASLAIIFTNLTWLKIWIAPKLFLLEYATDLIRKVS